MTEALPNVFSLASRLPEADQDAITARLMAELESECKWDALFRDSQNVLAEMAKQALAEHSYGETEKWKQN